MTTLPLHSAPTLIRPSLPPLATPVLARVVNNLGLAALCLLSLVAIPFLGLAAALLERGQLR